ncbi:MAG TPA: MFS transporter [Pilimelia sp.]|nr:MFS transporter [Pilimelia sp.]
MTRPYGAGLGRFGVLWLGQLVSLVGSSLTSFVLGVWVYQRTGSATQFALIALAAVVPGILVAPLAGSLADRLDRRRLLILSDLGAAVPTLALAGLLWAGELAVWHIYVTAAVGALCGAVHMTAYHALVPSLVPQRHLGRANGLAQVSQAAQIAAPLAAGTLLGTVGLRGVIVIDLVSAAVAIAVLLALRLPAAVTAAPGAGQPASLRADVGHGWRYLRARPGLFGLVLLFGAFNFLFALAGILVQPLILSFSSPATLGVLMFVGGSGLFVGGLAMGVWGGPRRRVRAVLIVLALDAVTLALHGLRPSPWLIAVVAPAFLVTLPVVNATVMTVLQTKVESASLGRVIATARMVGQSAMPLAYLLAGPLADRVAEPAMRPGGPLAGSVGQLIGVGPGRGIALVFWGIGAATLLVAVAGALAPRLRAVERELPDALAEPPAQPQSRAAAEPPGRAAAEPPGNGAASRPAHGDRPGHGRQPVPTRRAAEETDTCR